MEHRAPIELASYSPQWQLIFEAERTALASVFSGLSFRIEHIGSTAVPGLGAKPIVDVLVGAPSLADVEARIPATEALGYRYMPEYEAILPQRRFFAKSAWRRRQFHVHAVVTDSSFFAEHLLFRDSLRASPRLAAEYFSLKVELAARFGDDREGYADAKGSFIQAVIRDAASARDHPSAGA